VKRSAYATAFDDAAGQYQFVDNAHNVIASPVEVIVAYTVKGRINLAD
jgi:hypothetical protein